MTLSTVLSIDYVLGDMCADNKKLLLHTLADQTSAVLDVEREVLYAALLHRERLGTTAMGTGVAIPHARLPGIDCIYGFFTRLTTPLDFEAVDRQPVDLVFMLIAPEDAGSDHLQALIEVSSTLRDTNLCEQLRRAKTPAQIYNLLTAQSQRQAA